MMSTSTGDGHDGLLRMVRGTGRDAHHRIGDADDFHFVARHLFRVRQPDRQLIRDGRAVRRVVNLEAELRAFGQSLGEAFGIPLPAVARHVGREEAVAFVHRRIDVRPVVGGEEEDEDVVHDGRSRSAEFPRPGPIDRA